jgi:hypothetical protein
MTVDLSKFLRHTADTLALENIVKMKAIQTYVDHLQERKKNKARLQAMNSNQVALQLGTEQSTGQSTGSPLRRELLGYIIKVFYSQTTQVI